MAKQPRNRTLDSRDADALDTLIDSRGWQLVDGRIRHELGVQMSDLKRQHTEVETATIRGFIAGLELAGTMPVRLRKEAGKGGIVE